MFGSFGCAACSRYPLLFHFDSCNFFIYYRYYTHLFIYILYIYFLFLSFFPFGPPSTHWVVPRALFIKLVKRSCPVPVTDTLCWVSFSLAVGALYKLYYYYYYYFFVTSLFVTSFLSAASITVFITVSLLASV